MANQTTLEALQQAKENLCNRLAEISANPKPSYSDQGRTVSWTEYQSMIITNLQALDQAIARASGPYEIVSVGVT